jgi:hypothetical protein
MDCSRAQTKNPDRWIENCPEFARPICAQLREWFVRWEPDLTESIKWNMLCFSGRKLVCGLSGCKRHVGIAFFRGTELPDPAGLFFGGEENTAIQSVRLTSPDVPKEPLRRLLRAAVNLDLDPDRPPPRTRQRAPWPVPDFFADALKADPKAAAGFASFAPTYQREYLVWLTTAKREETRQKRLTETLAALRDGRKWIDRKKA